METSKGIVLNAVKYSDTHTIVTVYTEQAGCVPFVVRKIQKGGGRTQAAVWQVLSVVDVCWNPLLRKDLQTPESITLHRPWKSLAYDPVKTAMSLFLGEFLYRSLKGEGPNSEMFQFLEQGLMWFDEATGEVANFHIYLLLHLTSFLGFSPNMREYIQGGYFDLREASFISTMPMHTQYLIPSEARYVPVFWRMSTHLLVGVHLNGMTRRRILSVLIEYYKLHLPEFSAPKSLEILAEVFS